MLMPKIIGAVRAFSRQAFSALHFPGPFLSGMLRSPQSWQFY